MNGRTTVQHNLLPTRRITGRIVCAFIAAVLAVVAGVGVWGSWVSHVAYADDDDESAGQKAIHKAYDDYKPDDNKDHSWGYFEKYNHDKNKTDPTSFAYVMTRMFTTHYLNDTSEAQTDQKNPGLNCNPGDPAAGTPVYHNCDVPNALTELLQNVAGAFLQYGVQGGYKTTATLQNKYFGLPSSIPGGGAPVKPSDRSVKYTGLELYGYNFKFSSYAGEWDHIEVNTAARTMANLGGMDDLKMTTKSVMNGISKGVSKAAEDFKSDMFHGHFWGAFTDSFHDMTVGGASATINSVLDSSDLNVFASNSWYRVGYGHTLYNGREVTPEELKANARKMMLNHIRESKPGKAKLPADLAGIKNGPPAPKEAISKCTITDGNGKANVVVGNTKKAPGISQADCQKAAQQAATQRVNAHKQPSNAVSSWGSDGSQKKQSLADWHKANTKVFDTASKYHVGCPVSSDEKKRAASLDAMRKCYAKKWPVAAKRATLENQIKENAKWGGTVFKTTWSYLFHHKDENYNAPWNRFVCTKDGKDVKGANGAFVYLYDEKGHLNKGCHPVRPPIQDGLFGNGYLPSQNTGDIHDTRTDPVVHNFITELFPITHASDAMAQAGMATTVFITKMSNTIVNASFSTLLDVLGLSTIVTSTIASFRDSVFLPLSTVMAGVVGLHMIWGLRRNQIREQLKSGLFMVIAFVLGVIFTVHPEKTVQWFDTYPAKAEQAIIAIVFGVNNPSDDQLCTATGTVGKDDQDSASALTRTMLCENWRAFAFGPWVHGQWGAGYANLYAAHTTPGGSGHLNNSNGDLVGTAAVSMGANRVVHNWALYQLDRMSTGTASFADTSSKEGALDPNMYRLVDLQAGPHGGEKSDGSHFQAWSGMDPSSRAAVGFMSPIAAIVGFITVSAYSLTKIVISFITIFMLMAMPFMFLIGMHPTHGRGKLRKYAGNLAGLMVQRFIMVMSLGIMLRLVTEAADSSDSYFLTAIATVAICLMFLKVRKPVLNRIFEAFTSTLGVPVGVSAGSLRRTVKGGGKPSATRQKVSAVAQGHRQGIKNAANAVTHKSTGGGSRIRRAAAGYRAGVSGGHANARAIAHQGTGLRAAHKRASTSEKRRGVANAATNPFARQAQQQAHEGTAAMKVWRHNANRYNNVAGAVRTNANGKRYKMNQQGEAVYDPGPPPAMTQVTSRRGVRDINRIARGLEKTARKDLRGDATRTRLGAKRRDARNEKQYQQARKDMEAWKGQGQPPHMPTPTLPSPGDNNTTDNELPSVHDAPVSRAAQRVHERTVWRMEHDDPTVTNKMKEALHAMISRGDT